MDYNGPVEVDLAKKDPPPYKRTPTLHAGNIIDIGGGRTELFSMMIQNCVITESGMDVRITTLCNVRSFCCICMRCGLKFSTKSGLQQHIIEIHLQSEKDSSYVPSLSNCNHGNPSFSNETSLSNQPCLSKREASLSNEACTHTPLISDRKPSVNEVMRTMGVDVGTMGLDVGTTGVDVDTTGVDVDTIVDVGTTSVDVGTTGVDGGTTGVDGGTTGVDGGTFSEGNRDFNDESDNDGNDEAACNNLPDYSITEQVDNKVKGQAITPSSKNTCTNKSSLKVAKETVESTAPQSFRKRPEKASRLRMRITCEICGKNSQGPEKFALHMNRHAGMKPYNCSLCDKGFTFKKFFDIHMKKHEDGEIQQKMHTCKECGKKVATPESLKQHRLIHTGEKSHQCTYCGKLFRLKQTLRVHVRTHTGEKQYKCDVCGKTFGTKGILLNHSQMHQDPILCTICGKTFQYSCHLKRHTQVQHENKRAVCKICGKSFKGNSALKVHLQLHTGEKQLPCPECGEKFNHRIDLENHIRKHTGETPFQCTVCGHAFRIESSLIRHLKTVHGEMPMKIRKRTNKNNVEPQETTLIPDMNWNVTYFDELMIVSAADV